MFPWVLNTPLKFAIFLNSSVLEAVTRRCSIKKVFLEISQNSQENTYTRVSFLIKLQDSACNFIKKDCGTSFLVNFEKNFNETFFLQNTSSGCFCSFTQRSINIKKDKIKAAISKGILCTIT